MTTFVDLSRSDFNGDFELDHSLPREGDILWRDQAGNDVLWLMNNSTPSTVNNSQPSTVATLPHVSPDWHVKATARFDILLSDDSDILWQNDTGALALWQMGGITVSAISALPNPGPAWHVVGDNDFDFTSSDEILFQNDNGALAIWTGINPVTGTVSAMYAGTQNPGPTWHVVGTGDTNNDFKAGILWQNDNGALVLWENATHLSVDTVTFNAIAALPTVDPSWHVKGMADLNGDGTADVVFQNDNGAVVVWEMRGTAVTAMNLVNFGLGGNDPGPTWHVVGFSDMNGDRKADILLQNDNGAAAVWEDYTPYGAGQATFLSFAITPNPNPNGHVWDLL